MRLFLRISGVILTVTLMGLIFFLSAQNADLSSATSGQLIEFIAEKVYPDFENLTQYERAEVVESFQFIARKAMHIAIYALLGFFAFLSFITYRRMHFPTRVFWPVLICLIYAASDEYHQKFVAGRSCELRDFGLDAIGILGMILLCVFFVKIIPSWRRATAYSKPRRKAPLILEASPYQHDLTVSRNGILRELHTEPQETEQVEAEPVKESQEPEEAEPLIEEEPVLEEAEELPKPELQEDIQHEDAEEVMESLSNDAVEEIPVLEEETVEASVTVEEPVEEKVEPREVEITDEMQYAASVIGKAVVEVTKLCNKLTEGEQTENRKELVNLALGRNEVLKSEILKILNLEIPFEEKKNLIEKEQKDTYDYFDSIIAQIS